MSNDPHFDNSDDNSHDNSYDHSYDKEQLRRIIEGAILAAGEALTVDKLHSLFEEHEAPEKSAIKDILQDIAKSCESRGFQLVEVASGWRFQVREDVATWVNRLWDEKPQKYSRAMLETLALIAYRQPLTRGDIEDVRGVAVSSQIVKTLVEREWVKIVGHRDVPGRPSLYATTRQFLDYFNLKSLDELPTLSELKDIDSPNGSLDWGEEIAGEETTGDQSLPDDTVSEMPENQDSDDEGHKNGDDDDGSDSGEVVLDQDDAHDYSADSLFSNPRSSEEDDIADHLQDSPEDPAKKHQ